MSEIDDYYESMAAINYEDQHRPQNQATIVEGICINPVLREGFDMTANEDRDPQEIKDWWGRPFIMEGEYAQADATYEEYAERCKDLTTIPLEDKPTWEQKQEESKRRFMERYPSGKRYEVRCLHGGAWDRSSYCGDFATLEAALEHAQAIDGDVYTGVSYKHFQ